MIYLNAAHIGHPSTNAKTGRVSPMNLAVGVRSSSLESHMVSKERPLGKITRGPLRALQIGMNAVESSGGGERYFFNLIRNLPAAHVAITGLVAGDPGILSEQRNVSSFSSADVGLPNRWAALRRKVAPILREHDLVAAHFAPYAFPILDRLRSRPLVVHFHGPWALESALEGASNGSVFIKYCVERLVYSQASCFLVLSRAFGDILERRYGVPSDRIRVVPGGVDLQKFRQFTSSEEARDDLQWPTLRPIVLSVRRLVHAKGLENLIQAVAAVRRVVPDVLMIIAGSGPLKPALEEQVRAFGLEHWIRFTGNVPDSKLPTMYRAADLFVVPTIALEGFGLVVVEALACGTPVLVTPVAGLPEVIKDLDPQLILPGAQPRDLANGIIRALSGALELPSEEACIHYARRFGWQTIAERVAEVYRDVC